MLRNKILSLFLAGLFLPLSLFGQSDIPVDESDPAAENPLDEILSTVEGAQPPREHWQAASLGITTGYLYNLCTVGAAIVNGGVAPLNGESLASRVGFTHLLMSDSALMSLKESSDQTDTASLKVVESYKAGGVLEGVDIGIYTMYDFNDWLGLPLFVRGGFCYVTRLMGGGQEVTLGSGVDVVATDAGSNWPTPFSYEGATMITQWGAEWIEVPVSFGFTWECLNRGKVYAGIGGSWFRGGFSVGVDIDKAFAAFLTAYEGESAKQVLEPVQETIKFTTYGISANMFLGMETFLSQNWALTAEYWAGGFANTVYAETEFTEGAGEAITMALGGPAVAGQDVTYITRFAYPVVLSTVTIKIGAKYYYNSLMTKLFQG